MTIVNFFRSAHLPLPAAIINRPMDRDATFVAFGEYEYFVETGPDARAYITSGVYIFFITEVM
jgi:hypothetical protein